MTNYRIQNKGRINYEKRINFSFDGKNYQGFEGDTVASALLANGVHLMGRSFKYHRPRGPVTAGSEEPNALIGTQRPDRASDRYEPNTRATCQEIYEGLITTSQNNWPSLTFDVGAINDRFSKLFSAGFYYKTFMWPKSFWDKVYEPAIRSAAGLGVSPDKADPDHYASRYLHCDILIIGAGPSGIAAALQASKNDTVSIVLVDENSEIGGTLLSESQVTIDQDAASDWLANALTKLQNKPNVRILTRTTAIGYYHQNMVGLAQKLTDHLSSPPQDAPRERLWRVRAKQVVLAQGAMERPLVFDGNDRPGVMLSGAASIYLNRYGVLVGRKPAFVTSHDSAWYSAFELADAGADVSAVIDTRSDVNQALSAEADKRGIPYFLNHTVSKTQGRLRISALTMNALNGDNVKPGNVIPCDALLMCGGWTPSLHLFSHTKGSLNWDEKQQVFLPGTLTEDCQIAGACRGLWGIETCLEDGIKAGLAALETLQLTTDQISYSVSNDHTGEGVTHKELPSDKPINSQKAFIDFQNDVLAKDIRLAVREGMRSIEHVKRYTTNGMATDQGKMSNMNGLTIAADALGKDIPKVGLTTFRPPYTPTTFGTFAGYHKEQCFEITRKSPIDRWAEKNGAVFEPVSLWRRAWYFPRSGESMHDAVARECASTRNSLGIFDASTLGKINIIGPDAAEFLNRLYTNPWTKLAVGRCRYGVLLGEDGFIRDDGVIGRMAEDNFHVTTTTGGAASVLNMMEDYLQTEWPDLQVWLTSTTEQWATIAINGPNARKMLAPLVEGLDLSDTAFPHMSVADCTVAGLKARLFRMSFTGELGFEINVPASQGLLLWDALMAAGKPYDICPYGTETMHVLRAEKGYIIVGQDTDGTLTPFDAGLGWAIGKKKPDFVGKRSLDRPDMHKADRKQLVGLKTKIPEQVLEEGAQIVNTPDAVIPVKMVGHVTSSYWSETLGHSIALAVVENGQNRLGETVYIPMPNEILAAEIVNTVFYDPDGLRLNG
ncbi:sarcosine oxidase subunit alpha [Sneathiella sp.]|jgi:sarcosine oxidase subunit alpha|uniref:sarcosine oxidase subunit alpha n=1 Tax=Sneathiella sp. TaxID=1964365 RepID=UPI0039E63383